MGKSARLWIVLAAAAAALPAVPSGAADLGDNPSECEIQQALLGKSGPDCPPPPPKAAPPILPAPSAPESRKPGPLDTLPLSASFHINFAFNSTEISPESQAVLDRIALVLQGPGAGKRFLIAGHTDAIGSAGENLTLSLKRAVAVRDYFIARHALPADRLEVEGRGKSRPADPAHPTAAVNRRVEIINLGN